MEDVSDGGSGESVGTGGLGGGWMWRGGVYSSSASMVYRRESGDWKYGRMPDDK